MWTMPRTRHRAVRYAHPVDDGARRRLRAQRRQQGVRLFAHIPTGPATGFAYARDWDEDRPSLPLEAVLRGPGLSPGMSC